ncbi:hypothetical protein HRD68_00985 (plasmid) [Yersinia massiliensis]|uniref:hypothetical protein n=1 Tax=Yersinia massiliensis TaxID=419257 RepID=UPI0015629BB1|nr:hypothetical protein [Yersinia massiliensis]QKJ09432.1 hypothetical protein HRD68_00985 [Yersinia massiliensis]
MNYHYFDLIFSYDFIGIWLIFLCGSIAILVPTKVHSEERINKILNSRNKNPIFRRILNSKYGFLVDPRIARNPIYERMAIVVFIFMLCITVSIVTTSLVKMRDTLKVKNFDEIIHQNIVAISVNCQIESSISKSLISGKQITEQQYFAYGKCFIRDSELLRIKSESLEIVLELSTCNHYVQKEKEECIGTVRKRISDFESKYKDKLLKLKILSLLEAKHTVQ